MKTYRVFWNDGTEEEISGVNAGDALLRAGYNRTIRLPYWKIVTVS
jgi:hypothetical protein